MAEVDPELWSEEADRKRSRDERRRYRMLNIAERYMTVPEGPVPDGEVPEEADGEILEERFRPRPKRQPKRARKQEPEYITLPQNPSPFTHHGKHTHHLGKRLQYQVGSIMVKLPGYVQPVMDRDGNVVAVNDFSLDTDALEMGGMTEKQKRAMQSIRTSYETRDSAYFAPEALRDIVDQARLEALREARRVYDAKPDVGQAKQVYRSVLYQYLNDHDISKGELRKQHIGFGLPSDLSARLKHSVTGTEAWELERSGKFQPVFGYLSTDDEPIGNSVAKLVAARSLAARGR